MKKTFYDQPIDSNIKNYEEIPKIITGQDKNYTTWCLLNCDYIKNHCKLIAIYLKRKKVFDADPKAIQHRELVRWLRNTNYKTADAAESTFPFQFFKKIKETKTSFSKKL